MTKRDMTEADFEELAGKVASDRCISVVGRDLTDISTAPIDRVHEWRNYLPDPLFADWENLPAWVQVIIFAMCENQADKEEWD